MASSQTQYLSYTIAAKVNVDGVDLPPGQYKGKRVRLGTAHMGATQWLDWEYKIDCDPYAGLDCTKQVADGSIKLTP